MSSLLLSTWTPNTSSFALLIGLPRLIIGFCFFLCFMWLALHGRHSPRWRTAFATAALTPVIVWFSTMALAFMGARPSTPFTFMIPQLLMAGIEGLALAAAMIGDWRADAPRHWSHWLGAGSRLSVMAMTTGLYAVYVLFPAVLMGR